MVLFTADVGEFNRSFSTEGREDLERSLEPEVLRTPNAPSQSLVAYTSGRQRIKVRRKNKKEEWM